VQHLRLLHLQEVGNKEGMSIPHVSYCMSHGSKVSASICAPVFQGHAVLKACRRAKQYQLSPLPYLVLLAGHVLAVGSASLAIKERRSGRPLVAVLVRQRAAVPPFDTSHIERGLSKGIVPVGDGQEAVKELCSYMQAAGKASTSSQYNLCCLASREETDAWGGDPTCVFKCNGASCHTCSALSHTANLAAASDHLLRGLNSNSLGQSVAFTPCNSQCLHARRRTCRVPVWAAVLRPVLLVPTADGCGAGQGGGWEEGVPYESRSQGGP
jgi:hypothetical protein